MPVQRLAPAKQRYFWQDAVRHILRDRLTMVALIGLIIMTTVCIIGPVIIGNVLHIDINRTSITERSIASFTAGRCRWQSPIPPAAFRS
jgi:hypothetical protein